MIFNNKKNEERYKVSYSNQGNGNKIIIHKI